MRSVATSMTPKRQKQRRLQHGWHPENNDLSTDTLASGLAAPSCFDLAALDACLDAMQSEGIGVVQERGDGDR
eukprot:3242312-Lingulodinium_polyedra.AAC.1